jgi:hypothetical protein
VIVTGVEVCIFDGIETWHWILPGALAEFLESLFNLALKICWTWRGCSGLLRWNGLWSHYWKRRNYIEGTDNIR